jgi:hypothetical protein
MVRTPVCKCLNFNWIRLPAGSAWDCAGSRATTTASDTTRGEAPAWAVVFGLDFQAITEDGVEGAGGRRPERSQNAPIGGRGRRDPRNRPMRLLHARCGTKPNSDNDQSGFPPVHSVQGWGGVTSVSD